MDLEKGFALHPYVSRVLAIKKLSDIYKNVIARPWKVIPFQVWSNWVLI